MTIDLEEDNELLRDENQRLREELGGLYARMLRGELVDSITQSTASASAHSREVFDAGFCSHQPEPNSGEVDDNNPSLPERIWIESWDAEYHLTPRDKDSVEYTRTNLDGGKEYVRGVEDAAKRVSELADKQHGYGAEHNLQKAEALSAASLAIRALITQPKESQ